MFTRYTNSHPAAKVVIFAASLGLMYWAFYLIYGNHTSAILLVGSVAVHELGHLAAYLYYGLRGGIIFLPPIGAVMIPSDQEAAKRMQEWRKGIVAFAGPAVNIGLAAVGLVMIVFMPEWRSFGLMMTSLNGTLAAFNLLPFSLLDGGNVAKSLFNSADEAGDRRIVWYLTRTMIGCFVAVALFGTVSLMPVLFIWRLHTAANDDDPDAWQEPTAMKKHELHQMTRLYAAAAVVTFFIAAVFRYWNDYR